MSDFEEIQRFNQKWIWTLLILMNIGLLAIFGQGLVEQLVHDRPWGDRTMSDSALVTTSVIIFMFSGGMLLVFYRLRLITRVTREGLYIRFMPLGGKMVNFADIQSCEARTYRPMTEYGGWGIKWGRSGKAYNVSGTRGVQLVMRDGKRLLIGSQRADELAAAINHYL